MNPASFSEHLDALRKTLFQIVCVITIGFIFSFSFSNEIIEFLSSPLKEKRSGLQVTPVKILEIHNPEKRALLYKGEEIAPNETKRIEIKGEGLYLFSPAEGLIMALKISLWTAILFTAPLWLIPLFWFISPALHAHERRFIIPFFLTLATFLGLGIWMALKLTLPITNQYFLTYNQDIGTNLWGLANYLDYTTTLILAHGVGFELIGALFLLVHYQILDLDFLRSKRRHVMVLSLIIGALLTPPDVLSQLLVAIPLYFGYELILLYGSLRKRRLLYAHGN